MKKRPVRLGELQLRIMRVLWSCAAGEGAAVRDVHAQVGEGLAYTTVATMLRKMEERGLVNHSQEGRRFVYRPLITPQQVSPTIAADLVDRVFDGSLSQTVQHLLETRDVDAEELVRLEKLIRAHRKQGKAGR